MGEDMAEVVIVPEAGLNRADRPLAGLGRRFARWTWPQTVLTIVMGLLMGVTAGAVGLGYLVAAGLSGALAGRGLGAALGVLALALGGEGVVYRAAWGLLRGDEEPVGQRRLAKRLRGRRRLVLIPAPAAAGTVPVRYGVGVGPGLGGQATDERWHRGARLASVPEGARRLVARLAAWAGPRLGRRWAAGGRLVERGALPAAFALPEPYRARRAALRVYTPGDARGPEIAADGVIDRRDGAWVGLLGAGAVIAASRGAEMARAWYEELGEILAQQVAPGRTIQFVADNRAALLGDIQAARALRETSRHPVLVAMREERDLDEREWYGAAHAADVIHTIAVDGATPEALRQGMADVSRALAGHGIAAGPLDGGAVRRRLAEAAGVDRLAEGAEPDLGALAVDARQADQVRVRPGGAGSGSDGEWLARTLCARDLSQKLYARRFGRLGLLPLRSRLSVTLRMVEPEEAERVVRAQTEHQLNSNEAVRRRTGSGRGDAVLDATIRGLERAAGLMAEGKAGLVEAQVALTVFARDRAELERATTKARAAMRAAGLVIDEGLHIQGELYTGSLPLAHAPVARFLATTVTMGGACTLHKESPGHRQVRHLWGRTEFGGEIVGFDWRATATRALQLAAKQGGGKSMALGGTVLDLLQQECAVTIPDPTHSYETIARALVEGDPAAGIAGDPASAVVIRLMAEGVDINLLELVGAVHGDRVLALTEIFDIVFTNGRADTRLSAGQATALERGLRYLVRRRARTGRPLRAHSLAVYFRWQAHGLRVRGTRFGEAQADLYEDMASTLGSYAGEGTYASLFDRPTRLPAEVWRGGAGADPFDAQLFLLDTELLITKERSVAPLLAMKVGQAVANLRAARAAARGTRVALPDGEELGYEALLGFEEAWDIIKKDLPWIMGTARVIRHGNLMVAVSTQNPSDMARDRDAATIMTAFNTTLFGRVDERKPGEKPAAEQLADLAGLPLEVAHGIARARREMGVYSEMCMATKRPEVSDPECGFYEHRVFRAGMYLLLTYDTEKKARLRDAALHGSVWAAARAYAAAARAGARERTAA